MEILKMETDNRKDCNSAICALKSTIWNRLCVELFAEQDFSKHGRMVGIGAYRIPFTMDEKIFLCGWGFDDYAPLRPWPVKY